MSVINLTYYSANPSAIHWYIQKVGWYVMMALALWGICYIIWVITRKQLSLLMPVQERTVEVLKIVGTDLKALDGQNYMPSKAKVVVSYRKNGKSRKITLYANHVGVQEGDQGILRYRGVFCTDFVKQGSFLEEQANRYYHFGFAKNKPQVTAKKELKKRKYW